MGDKATRLSGGFFLSFDKPMITNQRNKKNGKPKSKSWVTIAKCGECAVSLICVFQLRHQFFSQCLAIEVATGGCWIVGYSIALGNAIRAMFRRHFYPLKKIFHRHYSEIFV
jgi:hypothetical protein